MSIFSTDLNMFSWFKRKMTPEPLPPPEPIPELPQEAQRAPTEQRKAAEAKRTRRTRTLLTGGLGDESEARVSRKTLLGR